MKRFVYLLSAVLALFSVTFFSSCDNTLNNNKGKENQEPGEPKTDEIGEIGEIADLLILQVYGSGSKTDGAVSHSFVELYNLTDADVDLAGYSLQYSGGGTTWDKLNLTGTIKAKSSFLVLGKVQNTAPRLNLAGKADQTWGNKVFDNKKFKIALIKSSETLTVANPFNTDGEGAKAAGYVDLFGSVDNDSASVAEGEEPLSIDGYETVYPMLLSKQKSARRITVTDTDNNKDDFEGIDYRVDRGIPAEQLVLFSPRNSAAGSWNPASVDRPAIPAPIPDPNPDPDTNPTLPSYVTNSAGLPILNVDVPANTANNFSRGSWSPATGYYHYDLLDKDGRVLSSGDTQMKGRGNSTWNNTENINKKPFSIKFAESYGVFGMKKDKRWNLMANLFDKSLIRNELGLKLGDIFDNMAWTAHSEQGICFSYTGPRKGREYRRSRKNAGFCLGCYPAIAKVYTSFKKPH
ncbi:hypothetical protein FACS189473_1330 [Spirochaetia bacterium]|nr:hypothetical protein FACS189473_1330 [Spirochaetia bacterium]